MKVEELVDMSKVKATVRCPKCGSPWINRRAVMHDGALLYDLDEWCSNNHPAIGGVCKWSRTVKNVKVG